MVVRRCGAFLASCAAAGARFTGAGSSSYPVKAAVHDGAAQVALAVCSRWLTVLAIAASWWFCSGGVKLLPWLCENDAGAFCATAPLVRHGC